MTDLTAREVVETLHQYDDLPSFPKINIHFLATPPGNEHLLKFMTDKPDNPIRFKGKRIGIIATHGVEETEVSIPRKWFEARAPSAIRFTENSGWIPIDARIEEATVEDYDASMCPGVPGTRISCAPTQPCCPSFRNFSRQANPWARCATARRSF